MKRLVFLILSLYIPFLTIGQILGGAGIIHGSGEPSSISELNEQNALYESLIYIDTLTWEKYEYYEGTWKKRGFVNYGDTQGEYLRWDTTLKEWFSSPLSVNLASEVTGVLPIANGGTGSTTLAGAGIATTATGTVNYLPKYTAGTVLGNSQIFDNGTNVGIGTASPKQKLTINGAIEVGINSAGGGTQIYGRYSAPHFLNIYGSQRSTGATFIGYGVKPSSVNDNEFLSSASIASFNRSAITLGAGINFLTNTSSQIPLDTVVTLYSRMRITNDGNVGIGNESPTSKLYLIDDKELTSSYALTAVFESRNSNGNYNPRIQIRHSDQGSDINHAYSTTAADFSLSVANNKVITLKQSGNVGIGNTSPSERLHVSGNIRTDGSDTQFLGSTVNNSFKPNYSFLGDDNTGIYSPAANIIGFSVGGREVVRIRDRLVNAKDGFVVGGPLSGAGLLTTGAADSNSNRVGLRLLSSYISSSTNVNDVIIGNGQADGQHTTGYRNIVRIGRGYKPTSGNGTYTALLLEETINQTGGANGIVRGIHIKPTLTSAPNYRALEISNNSGYGIYGEGTADNYLAGNLGIATTTPLRTLHVAGNARITNLTTDPPTRIVGADADGDLGEITVLPVNLGGTGAISLSAAGIATTSSGTVNYLPKYTSGTGLGNSQIFDNGTNVGIGATSLPITFVQPTIKLQVSSTTTSPFTNTVLQNNSNQRLWLSPVVDVVGSYIFNNAHYFSSYQYRPNHTSASGIWFKGDGTINFMLDDGLTIDTLYTPTERFTMLSNGNFGIDRINPSQRLHVNGNILTSGTNPQFLGQTTNASTNPVYSFSGDENTGLHKPTTGDNLSLVTGGIERLRITSTGRVGIGTTSPATIFDVADGDARINGVYVGLGDSDVTNIAIGGTNYASGATGQHNLAIGYSALRDLDTGLQNIGIGTSAGASLTDGTNNIYMGRSSGINQTSGNSNLLLGPITASNATTLTSVIAIGLSAARFAGPETSPLTNASNSIFIGVLSRPELDNQENQIVIGHGAMGAGSNSVVLGNTDVTKTVLRGNVYLGEAADIYRNDGTNDYPYIHGDPLKYNTFIGELSGFSSPGQDGNNNTAIGAGAMYLNDTGNFNTAIGAGALSSAAGNTANGNTAIGHNSMSFLSTGYSNVAIGSEAMKESTQGQRNVVIGKSAMTNVSTSTSNDNVVIGHFAAGNFGSSNSSEVTSLSNSIMIGSNARPYGNSETNQIVIGHQAVGKGNNTVTIGNSGVYLTQLFGRVKSGSFIAERDTSFKRGFSWETTSAAPYGFYSPGIDTIKVKFSQAQNDTNPFTLLPNGDILGKTFMARQSISLSNGYMFTSTKSGNKRYGLSSDPGNESLSFYASDTTVTNPSVKILANGEVIIDPSDVLDTIPPYDLTIGDGLYLKGRLNIHDSGQGAKGQYIGITRNPVNGADSMAWISPNQNQYYFASSDTLTTDSLYDYDTYVIVNMTTSDTLTIPEPTSSLKGKKIHIVIYGGSFSLTIDSDATSGLDFIHERLQSSHISIGHNYGNWQNTIMCMQTGANTYQWVTISQ